MFLSVVLFISTLFCGFSATAQQTIQLSQFKENRFIINPAATGMKETWIGNVGFRKQWAGLDNSPSTFLFGIQRGFRLSVAVHEPLALRTSRNEDFHFEQQENKKSEIIHGLGFFGVSDQYGAFRKTSINLSYAIHIPVWKEKGIKASLGANAGFNNLRFNQELAMVSENNDITYNRFVSEQNRNNMIDLNIGAYIYNKDFFAGYSTNQLFGDHIALNNLTVPILVLHHSILGGYRIDINDKIQLTPNFYAKMVTGAPLSADLNIRLDYDQNYFGGVSFRNQDAIVVLAGMHLKNTFSIGYSYDFNTSLLSRYSGGGHEINLIYYIN